MQNKNAYDEKSCGTILFCGRGEGLRFLLIRNPADNRCGFPKGHVEAGETERETAMREVMEETSVRITIVPDFRHVVCYTPAPAVEKEVVYFLARTEQIDIRPRRGEIAQVEWIPLLQAERYLTHENDKRVLTAARDKLNALSGN